MPRVGFVRIGLLLAAASCVVAVGCGNSASSRPRVQVLTTESVDRYRQGSPERAVIEWWRDIQYKNVAGVADRYASSARVTPETIEDQLPAAEGAFESIPRIDAVTDEGSVSTVYVLAFPFRRPNDTDAYSARLTREGREWKLADNSLLERLQVARSAAATRQRPEEPETGERRRPGGPRGEGSGSAPGADGAGQQ